MMMKEKSNPWARVKYLYMLPVAAICMIACTQSPKSADKAEEETSIEQTTKVKNSSENATVSEEHIYQVVEENPEFPGGIKEALKFLSQNINYPKACQEKGIQGRVIVQFIVTKEGDIKDPVVVRGVDPQLDAEALRVIKAMPKWKPGKQKGKAVNVRYTQPVLFKSN